MWSHLMAKMEDEKGGKREKKNQLSRRNSFLSFIYLCMQNVKKIYFMSVPSRKLQHYILFLNLDGI